MEPVLAGSKRVSDDDFVCVRFDGVRNKDASKLDELGRKFFTKNGVYNRKDLFYFFLFQLRCFDDLTSGLEARIKADVASELERFRQELDGETHGATQG